MKIDRSNIDWLSINYPDLVVKINDKSVVIEGDLVFSAQYSKETETYQINPTASNSFLIEDSYHIKIETELFSNEYPVISEPGGRLLGLAVSKNIRPKDLHVYSGWRNNKLCTIGPIAQELIKSNLSLQALIEKILIPFFYDSSYYEKNDIRLRRDYSHEIWGLIENYFELAGSIDEVLIEFVKKEIKKCKEWEFLKDYFVGDKIIKGHLECFVCKKNKIRNCHPCVFRGIRRIQKDGIFKT